VAALAAATHLSGRYDPYTICTPMLHAPMIAETSCTEPLLIFTTHSGTGLAGFSSGWKSCVIAGGASDDIPPMAGGAFGGSGGRPLAFGPCCLEVMMPLKAF